MSIIEMAGHNGHEKFLKVNREDEVILFKSRDTQFAAYSKIHVFDQAGGGQLLQGSDYILNPLRFETTASGNFLFPPTFNDEQFLKDIRNVRSFFTDDLLFQPIFNTSGNAITINLPTGFVNSSAIPSANSIEIPANSYVELMYQYTGTGFDVFQVSSGTGGGGGVVNHDIISGMHTDTILSGGSIQAGDILQYDGANWTNAPPSIVAQHEIISATHSDTVLSGGAINPGDVLQYNGSDWTNTPISTAIQHDIISPTHTDTALSGPISAGDVLQNDGTNWTNVPLSTAIHHQVISPTHTDTVLTGGSINSGDLFQYNGTNWTNIPATTITQHEIISPTHTDTQLSGGGLNTGDILQYNGANWTNTPIATAVQHQIISSTHTDTSLTSALANGQFLFYDGTNWTNRSLNTETEHTIIGPQHTDSLLNGALANGQVLFYNGTNWTNQPLAAEIQHTIIGSTHTDTVLTGALNTGDLLQYNGTNWTNTPTTTVIQHQILSPAHTDTTVTGVLSANDVLLYNGSAWTNFSYANLSQHNIISPTHSNTTYTGPGENIYDVLVYDGTDWTNSSNVHTGRLQMILTNTIRPSTGTVTTFGETGVPYSFNFISNSTDPVIINAEDTQSISAGQGILNVASNDTSFQSTGASGGAAIRVSLPNNNGNPVNTFFILCTGEINNNMFFVRTCGSLGTWFDGDILGERQGAFYAFNRSASGLIGSGTTWSGFFLAESTNAATRAPEAGPGVRAYGWFDLINIGLGAQSTNTTRPIFAVNSRGEMYVRDLRNVGNTVNYNNPLFINSTTGEIVYQAASSASKYKHDIDEMDTFIDSTLIYDLNLKKFRYNWTPEQVEIGLVVDELDENPKAQEFLIRDEEGAVDYYRKDYLQFLMLREIQKMRQEITQLQIIVDELENP